MMVGPFHDLDEHVGGEFVGLITGGDADDGEVAYPGAQRDRVRRDGAVG